jgi:1-acyl-sn-glycerol-3-phosphate acyltransferase
LKPPTIKDTLYTLFGIYCLVVFLVSLVVVFPLYFILFLFGGKKAPAIAHGLSRIWARTLFLLFLIRVEVRNKELIDPNAAYVFVANHLSMLDIPLYAIACSNTFRFLSKAELAKIPLLGYVIRKLYITVNRSDKTDRGRSIEKMRASLEEGISIFLAPEGTRNTTDVTLLPFKDGAFLLAVAAQKPIAVLTLLNTHECLSPKHPLKMRPGKLIAEWSQPILTVGLTEKDIPTLKEEARRQMLSILPKRSTSVEK